MPTTHQRSSCRRRFAVIATSCTCLALSSCATMADTGPGLARGEARLAAMIGGKQPGEPRSCIAAFNADRLEILDHTAIVYDSGDTVWVSRPLDPHSLDTRDVVVIERAGGQLCKQDIVRTVDRSSGITTGAVFMGDFVPYR